MAKTYKVGILGKELIIDLHNCAACISKYISVGNQDGVGGFFGGKYGAEVFDLTADQICNFLENPDIDQCKTLESL